MPQFDLMIWSSRGPHMDLGLSWLEWLWFPQGAHLILLNVVLFYASPGLVILFPIWVCMTLVILVLTQASLGPGYSIPHLGLTLTRALWSHFGPQTKLVTLVPPLGLTLFW